RRRWLGSLDTALLTMLAALEAAFATDSAFEAAVDTTEIACDRMLILFDVTSTDPPPPAMSACHAQSKSVAVFFFRTWPLVPPFIVENRCDITEAVCERIDTC